MECYYSSKPATGGYMGNVAQIWEELDLIELTANRAAMQTGTTNGKEGFTAEELDEIRMGEIRPREREEKGMKSIHVKVIQASTCTLNRIHQRRWEMQEPERTDDNGILSEEQQELVQVMISIRERLLMGRAKLAGIRHVDKLKIMTEVRKLNEVIQYIPIDDITKLNDTFFARATIFIRKLDRER